MLHQQLLYNLVSVGLLLVVNRPIVAQTVASHRGDLDRAMLEISFTPPPDDGKPDDTSGAGSRQDCRCPQDIGQAIATQPSLMALVPEDNYGLTVAERPTFWLYVPQTSARQAVLSIREENGRHHSQTVFSLSATSGTLGIQLPPDAPPLQANTNYQWAVVLVCGQRPSPNDPAIASWIRRVVLSEPREESREHLSDLEQAAWYAKRGIWYDTLTAIASVRKAQPDDRDLLDIWTNLLQTARLEAIAPDPLQF